MGLTLGPGAVRARVVTVVSEITVKTKLLLLGWLSVGAGKNVQLGCREIQSRLPLNIYLIFYLEMDGEPGNHVSPPSGVKRKTETQTRRRKMQILVLPLPRWVALGMYLHVSGP